MEGTSLELESCLSAEEVYLLDIRASIEIESFVSLRRHCTVVAELRAFLQSGKEMHCFAVISGYRHAGAFHRTKQNVRLRRTDLLGSCLMHTYPIE